MKKGEVRRLKVRIKFSKEGPIKFIGHLDVMRYFQKAIRRADIDIAYSAGFSPHPILSFASPLSVGYTSEGEYFDMEINSLTDIHELKDNLNRVMADGIRILDAAVLADGENNAMASVAAAGYRVSFSERVVLPKDWKDRLLCFYDSPEIPVTKKTKKGEREINLKEGIYRLEIRNNAVYMLLDAGSGSNIKPGFVLETFFARQEIALPEFPFRIHRLETYKRKEDGCLVPLLENGSWEK